MMRVNIRHRDLGSRELLRELPRILAKDFEVLECEPGEALGDAGGADAVVAIGPVTAADFDAGRFRFVQIMGSGYEHVALESARRAGVVVANLPAGETGNATSVAELVLLLGLTLFRRLDDARGALRRGRLAEPLGRSLLNKTALILGMGDVGSATARLLLACGMKVVGTRRNVSRGGVPGVEVRGDDEAVALAGDADLVVVAARVGVGEPAIVGRPFLAAMRRSAVLVNVARAAAVDRGALLEALETGAIAGAGLDVFWEEPTDMNDPLLGLPNVIVTPHIGGVTDVHIARSIKLITENLRLFHNGLPVHFVVTGS